MQRRVISLGSNVIENPNSKLGEMLKQNNGNWEGPGAGAVNVPPIITFFL